MKITHEKETGSVYIYLKDAKIGKLRTQEVQKNVHVDWDADGTIFGIECLDVPEIVIEDISGGECIGVIGATT